MVGVVLGCLGWGDWGYRFFTRRLPGIDSCMALLECWSCSRYADFGGSVPDDEVAKEEDWQRWGERRDT